MSAAPPPLILGTAGHIDHGKTSLVRALTGVDTDRLPEEKARGITIELGFAPLDLGDGLRLGVVDVPGHEALVRTMVAGASGVDLVLLVVAADEGVMPQTREHVAICELLDVRQAVVALSKTDLVDGEMAELAADEVRALLAPTRLLGAPVVTVSAETGAGLDALRAALRDAARAAAAGAPRGGPPRLFVDRVFERRGFGPVVTGTLRGAGFRIGDALEILPGGRRARIRGLQCFGAAAERLEAGTRCAVNLQGVELAELARGQLLAPPGALLEAAVFDVELDWLAGSPQVEGSASALLLAGSAERRARLAPIGGKTLAPGERSFARLHLAGAPLALLPGERFVVRGFARGAAGSTLGGGRVLDVAPPRRRRSDPDLLEDLERLAAGGERDGVALRVGRAGIAGRTAEALVRETGLPRERVETALASLAAEGAAAVTAAGVWLGAPALLALETRLLSSLARFHADEPLRSGMPRAAARGALPGNQAEGAFERVLSRLAAAGSVKEVPGGIARGDFRPALAPEQRALAERLRAELRGAGLEPPGFAALLASAGCTEPALRDLLGYLEREGGLVRAAGDLWFDRGAVDALRERVRAYLLAHGRLETPAYKDLIGTSRKYAVPLMELFDAEQLTVRRGETRLLRPRGAPG